MYFGNFAHQCGVDFELIKQVSSGNVVFSSYQNNNFLDVKCKKGTTMEVS